MSNLKLYGLLLIFLLIGIAFAIFPIESSIQLYDAIRTGADSIAFEKGAYYLIGGGVLFTIGPAWILYILISSKFTEKSQRRLKKAEEERIQRNAIIFMVGCVALIDILPQVVSIGVSDYLENHGYTYCDKLSRQWLFNRTMVYTKKECN